nr:bifunctional 4-hydroxy-2-oxoglutarate aldolase/2-dehydro-3-deoxy-phosphogluconate aldolase [Leifsonia psychrotolerans]
MAIFRNMTPTHATTLAHRAWDLGIELVEVPIQTSDALPTLRAVVAAGRERGKVVGSGTVISLEQLEASRAAGVGFTVSPGLDEAVVAESARINLPHLPGVATASEIQRALALGCTWVKAFPASVLGATWFTTLRGPFPQVKFVATGGMDASNAAAFLDAGVSMVAVGSALADPAQVDLLAHLIAQRRANGGSEPRS